MSSKAAHRQGNSGRRWNSAGKALQARKGRLVGGAGRVGRCGSGGGSMRRQRHRWNRNGRAAQRTGHVRPSAAARARRGSRTRARRPSSGSEKLPVATGAREGKQRGANAWDATTAGHGRASAAVVGDGGHGLSRCCGLACVPSLVVRAPGCYPGRKKKGSRGAEPDRGSRGKDEMTQPGGTLRQTTALRQRQ